MTRVLAAGLVLAAFVSGAAAQNHVVNSVGFSFVDSVSGTNATVIPLGTTIEFRWLGGASHTATSGIDFSDPLSGVLFNMALNSATPIRTFTPTSTGMIPYYCVPHVFFGMVGTITVLSPAGLLYPGSNEDFNLGTAVNTPGPGPFNAATFGSGNDAKDATAGDVLTIQMLSAGGAFNFTPLLLAAQAFLTLGPPPAGPLAGLHVNVSATVLLNGLSPAAPLGLAVVVLPGGSTYGVQVPLGFAGFSVMFQSIAAAGFANNGFFAISPGQVIRIL